MEEKTKQKITKILSVGLWMVAYTRLDQSWNEKRCGSRKRKVEQRVLVMKCNKSDNLPYCGEYLSVNSG